MTRKQTSIAKEQDMHKDLSEETRSHIEYTARNWASSLHNEGQSLALAREAWINAFDKAAEELEAVE